MNNLNGFKKPIVLFFCLFILNSFSQNQKKEVAQWKFFYESEKSKKDFTLCFLVKLESGWHTYSQTEVVDGPVPTKISITPEPNEFEMIGNIKEPEGKKKMDEAFGIEIISFENEVKFTQSIRKKTDKKIVVKGNVEYMTCNSIQCNPPKVVPFEIEIP
jgi:thiol:disulfide interchange protein DsbD